MTTSANLTHRGMGTRDGANVELAHVSRDPRDLHEIGQIATRLKEFAVSPAKQLKQDEFVFAIRLLSSGHFYHQWQGSLSAEARFTLRLTRAGKRLGAKEQGPLRERGYETDADSVSRDPLKVAQVFKSQPKPIPATFIRMFTIDTLVGRWVPLQIAGLLDQRLNKGILPYLNRLRRQCSDSKLEHACDTLRQDVENLGKRGFVEGTPEIVARWREKIVRLRENRALVTRIVFNLERLDEPFPELDRRLILGTYESLKGSVEVKRTRGALKRILARAIDRRPADCVSIFGDLVAEARRRL